MRLMLPLVLVLALVAVGFIGWKIDSLNFLFAFFIPYTAVAIFIGGFIYRIIDWARSPVPFRIPTTAGQEKSLPWIKENKIDNPSSTLGVIARMALEVLLFRSLFRHTAANVEEGPRVTYSSSKWLWGAGLVFHWSFLIIFVRHFRLFVEPTPFFVVPLEFMDGFMQITLPTLYMTDVAIVAAVTYLVVRRVYLPQIRYLSLVADFFPLFLILGIAISGILMRYITKTDVAAIKVLIQGLVHLSPALPEKKIGYIFFVHLFLVSSLLIYFPFSKLMHMGGVFMSPTRNLANNSRMKRHINPWNPALKFHTYEEYEEDFWKVMKSVGLPLDKEHKDHKEEK